MAPGTGIDECYEEARGNFAYLGDRLPQTLWDPLPTLLLLQSMAHYLGEIAGRPFLLALPRHSLEFIKSVYSLQGRHGTTARESRCGSIGFTMMC